jgi:hypothetical protein
MSEDDLTRRNVADAIDELDDQIADINEQKAAAFQNYRASLAGKLDKEGIRAELSALKTAIRRRRKERKDPTGYRAQLDLFEEIVAEISDSQPRARARARVARPAPH